MRARQAGMTFVGFLMLAAMVGLLGFGALKLTPVYLENMKIRRVLQDVKAELDGQAPTPQTIRRSIEKRLDIEMVDGIGARDFLIQKVDGGFRVAATYDRTEPFVANVSLTASFDDEVEIGL